MLAGAIFKNSLRRMLKVVLLFWGCNEPLFSIRRKIMRINKIIPAIILLVLVISLTGCDEKKKEEKTNNEYQRMHIILYKVPEKGDMTIMRQKMGLCRSNIFLDESSFKCKSPVVGAKSLEDEDIGAPENRHCFKNSEWREDEHGPYLVKEFGVCMNPNVLKIQ